MALLVVGEWQPTGRRGEVQRVRPEATVEQGPDELSECGCGLARDRVRSPLRPGTTPTRQTQAVRLGIGFPDNGGGVR